MAEKRERKEKKESEGESFACMPKQKTESGREEKRADLTNQQYIVEMEGR